MLDKRVVSTTDVLDAGPVIVFEGMYPYRYVLRKVDDQYITHREQLTSTAPESEQVSCGFKHHCFADGHYFPFGEGHQTDEQAHQAAYKDLGERIAARR